MNADTLSLVEKETFLTHHASARPLLYTSLAPLSFFITFACILFNQMALSPYLLLTTIFATFTTFKWDLKGCAIGCASLLFVSFFTLDNSFWSLGLLLLLLTNLVIAHLLFKEANSALCAPNDSYASLKEKFREIQEEWQKERSTLFLQLQERTDETLLLKTKLRQSEREKEGVQNKLHLLYEGLSKEKKKWEEEKFVLTKELEEHKKDKFLPVPANLIPKDSKSPFAALYEQLRSQFEMKNQVLHETRKELFQKESALLLALHEQKAASYEQDDVSRSVERDLLTLAEENEALMNENSALLTLISSLSVMHKKEGASLV